MPISDDTRERFNRVRRALDDPNARRDVDALQTELCRYLAMLESMASVLKQYRNDRE